MGFIACIPCSIFFTLFLVLLGKSNCHRTLEPHVAQLFVIVFHMTALADLILHYFKSIVLLVRIRKNNMSYKFFIFFFHMSWSFTRPKLKIQIVKFSLLSRKNSISVISWTFFHYWTLFTIQVTQFCGNISKVVETNLPSPPLNHSLS